MDNQQLNVPEPALNIPPDPAGSQLAAVGQPRSKRGPIIGLVFGTIMLLVGGTYAAAHFNYITLPFPLPGTANDVIAKSLDALYNTTASESTSEFSIGIAPRDSSVPTLFPSTSNTSSTNDDSGSIGLGSSRLASAGTMFELIPDNLSITGSTTSYSEKTAGTGKMDGTMKAKVLAGETNVDADLNVRLLEENVFVKINTLKGIPNFDATDALSKWFTANVADAGNAARGFELIPENANADKALKESRQTIEQVLGLAQKHQLFKTKKSFGAVTIGGVKTRHTSHMINPKQVVPFFEDLIATRKKAGQDVSGTDDMVAELKKAENQAMLENFSKALTVDLWYDGKGKMMKKMSVTMVIVPPAESVKYKSSQFVLTFSTTLISSGQTKALATPTEAKPLEELFSPPTTTSEPLTGDTTGTTDGSSNSLSNDAQRKSDIATLRAGLALYYDDTNKYPNDLGVLVPTYLVKLPTDPITKSSYQYETCTINRYLLKAELESEGGPWYANDQGNQKQSTMDIACGTSFTSDTNTNSGTTANVNVNTNSLFSTDTDNDGLNDLTEALCKTRPDLSDSDNDGYSDKTEIENGYNPNGPGKATSTECLDVLNASL